MLLSPGIGLHKVPGSTRHGHSQHCMRSSVCRLFPTRLWVPLPLQIFCLSLCIFALALVGVFYPYNRGALFTALIVLYALTACIAGYVATSYYMQVGGPTGPLQLLASWKAQLQSTTQLSRHMQCQLDSFYERLLAVLYACLL